MKHIAKLTFNLSHWGGRYYLKSRSQFSMKIIQSAISVYILNGKHLVWNANFNFKFLNFTKA